jgi:hypothetical protein
MNKQLLIFALIGSFSLFSYEGKSSCVSGSITNATTNNCSDGAIDITVNGNFAPFTFQWSGPNGFSATTEDINGIKSGMYSVTVVDALLGQTSETFTVGVTPENIFVAGKINLSECSPFGTTGTGSIDISVPSSGIYTFNWSGPSGYSSTSQNISNLTKPGDYNVTITKNNGCSVVLSENLCCCDIDTEHPHNPNWQAQISWKCGNVGNPSTQTLNVEGEVNSPFYQNDGNGSIDLTVSGGSTNYFYKWTGPNGFSANTQDLSNLNPGEYCVKVKDGCQEKSKCFVLVVCSESSLSISGTVTNTCQGVSYGAINLSATGGTFPYKYTWSNTSTIKDLSNLATGQYCVTVKDASGCTKNRLL